jgi:hypothetical protein
MPKDNHKDKPMKKFSIAIISVLAIFAMFTMLNAETPPKAEKFPVLTGSTKGACCAKKNEAKKEVCEKEKCEKEKCEKEKCDTKEKCEKKGDCKKAE